MRIGLLARTDQDEALHLVKKISDHLSHHDIFFDEDLLPFFKGTPIQDVDILVVVGGDGTILRTVRKYDFPILAVKRGQYGHLCELKPEEISSIEDILKEHRIDQKMKIMVPGIGEALNEVVVRAVIPDKVARFRICYSGCSEEITGDGIIVATPTGSTAYSRAAGGPVIEEACSVFCITLICPLNSWWFPRVIPSNLEITITVMDKPCYMTLDGGTPLELKEGDSISIRKSDNHAIFWRKKWE
ncbi:MAG: NAD(+)/NADH kinase [Theionarchaea archaeon]|nr:NAD(+)/NADH kinase [Theionarchaea archaeon]